MSLGGRDGQCVRRSTLGGGGRLKWCTVAICVVYDCVLCYRTNYVKGADSRTHGEMLY